MRRTNQGVSLRPLSLPVVCTCSRCHSIYVFTLHFFTWFVVARMPIKRASECACVHNNSRNEDSCIAVYLSVMLQVAQIDKFASPLCIAADGAVDVSYIRRSACLPGARWGSKIKQNKGKRYCWEEINFVGDRATDTTAFISFSKSIERFNCLKCRKELHDVEKLLIGLYTSEPPNVCVRHTRSV